jgi:hypothetical protein
MLSFLLSFFGCYHFVIIFWLWFLDVIIFCYRFCYHFCYFFNVIILVIIFLILFWMLSFCYHFFIMIFGCYHFCYHFLLSCLNVIICYRFVLSFCVIILCYHFPPFLLLLKTWHTPVDLCTYMQILELKLVRPGACACDLARGRVFVLASGEICRHPWTRF